MKNEAVIVIQVRTCSSRLPAKALLPMAGMPLVVFIAMRAASSGARVIAAIPEDKTDDNLANILDHHGVEYFRGSQKNVLKRMKDGLSFLSNDQHVFRLTGDNLIADGKLLNVVYENFVMGDFGYLSASGDGSGLPRWGTGVELFRYGDLENALNSSTEDSEFESVTPQIKKIHGNNILQTFSHLDMEDYRCTIDTLSDYLYLARIIDKFSHPVETSFLELLEAIKHDPQ